MTPFNHLQNVARLNFGAYPTPLEELPRLQQALGANAPRLFIKRDDYTGPGFGGNKVRKLEYVLAQAVAEETDAVITIGGIKSNHCRVTAALCARLGLQCHLVLNTPALPPQKPATLWLDELYGATIHLVSKREERRATMQRLAEELRVDGLNVCEVPLGASTPLGALGYVRAMHELGEQLDAQLIKLDVIFHSSSSCGTQAGIIAGGQLFGLETTRVFGVSPDESAQAIAPEVAEIVAGIGQLLSVKILHDPVTVLDDYIGAGYGISTPAADEAIKLLARTEGIVLDPTYTAKAMAALLDWVRQGKFAATDTVLFWHTGGQMALFDAH